jgi:hypothetical protein
MPVCIAAGWYFATWPVTANALSRSPRPGPVALSDEDALYGGPHTLPVPSVPVARTELRHLARAHGASRAA